LRQDFERHTTTKDSIFGQVNFTHATFADRVQNLIMLNQLAYSQLLLFAKQRLGRACDCGRFHETCRFTIRAEQRFHFLA
jgi:hypothetical protein